ncbi:hypothetical protein GCM10011415_30930 [Salipiger pallidus]|uniref:Uncharacterized protein n=1 Tax=Salipiger pallidus TaxID=1775170 RepID=A0A8J3EI58_9RHOB|nr:hypothetical protein GCM10011415_30930 [Salipiger pallidus]
MRMTQEADEAIPHEKGPRPNCSGGGLPVLGAYAKIAFSVAEGRITDAVLSASPW